MFIWDNFLKVTDSVCGKEFLIFVWEKELFEGQGNYLIEPCSRTDFFTVRPYVR